MAKDWIGNGGSLFATLGATNHSEEDRKVLDYYATDPIAVKMLLELENFSNSIWECACGEGHISKVLESKGYKVWNTDIVNRGYRGTQLQDFLLHNGIWEGDIITNPPYKYAADFVEKALESIRHGNKVAMFLKIQFLESKGRTELFKNNPPKTVYISRNRIMCGKNGNFDKKESSAVCYCWYIWEKGFKGKPTIEWFN